VRKNVIHAIAGRGAICFAMMVVLLTTSAVSRSEVYRCLHPSGEEIFTDSPAQLGACTAMSIDTAQPPVNIVPLSSSRPSPTEDGLSAAPADQTHSISEISPDSGTPSMPAVNAAFPFSTSAPSPSSEERSP
jgi:hypothetical protein